MAAGENRLLWARVEAGEGADAISIFQVEKDDDLSWDLAGEMVRSGPI